MRVLLKNVLFWCLLKNGKEGSVQHFPSRRQDCCSSGEVELNSEHGKDTWGLWPRSRVRGWGGQSPAKGRRGWRGLLAQLMQRAVALRAGRGQTAGAGAEESDRVSGVSEVFGYKGGRFSLKWLCGSAGTGPGVGLGEPGSEGPESGGVKDTVLSVRP